MSSCLCKKAKDAVPPLMLFVVAIEDGIDNPVDAGGVDEAHHRSRAATNFHEAPLNDVGCAQRTPEVPREIERPAPKSPSFRLCYLESWRAWRDSNPRPTDSKSAALSN